MAKHEKNRREMMLMKDIAQGMYDNESDIFFIHKGFSPEESFTGNIDLGNIILDLSSKGRIRGIEIMHATQFLAGRNISKTVLHSFRRADFNIHLTNKAILITLSFEHIGSIIPAEISVPLTAGVCG